jgi:chromosome segregation ATPase
MEGIENQILSIEKKLVKLVDQQDNLKQTNVSLRKENEDLKALVSKQTEQISELENKIKMLKIAKSLEQTGEGNTEVKRKITEFVKEIDKCIALLNG